MREKTKGGKALKIISAIFLSLALLIMAALIVADVFLDDYLKDTISREVKEGTDGLYELEIGSLDLNLRTFKVRLGEIDFETDEAKYLAQLDDPNPLPFIALQADELVISQINILGFILGDRLQIHDIYIKNPVANIRMPETEEPLVIEEIWKDLQDFADPLLIGSIEIENLHLLMDFELEKEWHHMSLANTDFVVDGLRIDSAAAFDEERFIYAQRMRLNIQDTAIFDMAGMYKGSLSSLEADTEAGLKARNLVFHTNDSLYQSKVERQRLTEPYLELAIDDVDLAFEEWGKLLQGGDLHGKHLVVRNPNIYFVAPPSVPGDGGKESGYPRNERGFRLAFHEALNDHFPTFDIDSVRFNNANIHALIPEGPDTLSIRVPDLNLFLTDIRLDEEGASDPERFIYASEASLLTREGLNVRYNNELNVITDMFLLSTDSGLFVNNIQMSGSALENSEASVANMNVRFTEWGNLQQGDTTHVQSVAISKPKIRARIQNQPNANSNGAAQKGFRPEIHHTLNEIVALLTIGSLTVSDADIYATITEGADRLMVQVLDLNLSFSDIRLDETSAQDKERFMYAREASFMTGKGLHLKNGNEFSLKTGMLAAATDRGVFGNNIRYDASPEMEAYVQSFDVKFTQWGNLQQGVATHVSSIAVSNPKISANIEADTVENSAAGNGEKGFKLELHKALNEFVSQLSIGSVYVSNADIDAKITEGADQMAIEVPDLNISMTNVRLDAHGAKDASRFLYAKKASLMTKEGISINQPDLCLTTDMLVVSTDSGVFANNVQYSGSASPDIEATLEALNIHFTQWGQLQQGDSTHIESISLNSPDVSARMEVAAQAEEEEEEDEWVTRHPETPPVEGVNLKAIPGQVSAFVDLLTIGNLRINNGNFNVEMAGENEEFPALYNVQDLSIDMDNIRLDSAAAESVERFLFADDIKISMQRLDSRPDQMYDVGLENLTASSKEQSLSLNNMTLKPRYPKRVFAEVVGEETQRMDLELANFDIDGLDFNQLLDGSFIADLIIVDGVNWEIFVDSHLPSEEPEPPLYPHDMLSSLKAFININEIQVQNGHVVYEELAEGGHESGAFTFENFSATIKDVVNRPVEGYEYTSINVNFDLMGTGDFSGELIIPVLHPEKYFAFSGGMEPMNLEKLNPALEYIAFTRIDNGQMHSFRFEGEGNNERITGEVFANYEGLSIELLEEGPEEPGFLTGVISSLANRILSTDNLKGTDDFTIGDMDVARSDNQAFFGVLLEGLNRGLFDSFGVQRAMDAIEAIENIVPFLGDDEDS
jgi:hypothetical protein